MATRQECENQRSEIAKEITKAEIIGDLRSVVIWCRRFLDAWPNDAKTKIETAVYAVFKKKMEDAKFHLKGKCPVCGDHMYETSCPDDTIRSYCPSCQKTYTPMGYDSEDDYALYWWCIDWQNGEKGTKVRMV